MTTGTDGGDVGARARVLVRAGDAAARRGALTVPRRSWTDLGAADGTAWGRCAGSSAVPYEVVVDAADGRYACSCPSRKNPCKHALALLLVLADGQLPPGERPPFVARRLATAGPATAPRRPTAELVDSEAAAARVAARTARVAAGLEELATWMADQVRGGLAGLEQAGPAAVEAVAARMVDAQAPGVAGMLRGLAGELGTEEWPARVLERLAALHLLVEAHRRLPELRPDLAATVRSRIGYPVSKADVLAGPGVADEWLALGQLDALESRLETRRVWLWGRRTGRWALWLTFAPPGGAPDATIVAGERFRGRLHFYPGSGQHRAVLGEPLDLPAAGRDLPAAGTLADAQRAFATLLAADPWASRLPAVVRAVPVPPGPVPPGQGGPGYEPRWRLRDPDGRCRDVSGPGPEPWPLLAHSRGHPVPVVVEWGAHGVRPLAVLEPAAGDGPVVGRAA